MKSIVSIVLLIIIFACGCAKKVETSYNDWIGTWELISAKNIFSKYESSEQDEVDVLYTFKEDKTWETQTRN